MRHVETSNTSPEIREEDERTAVASEFAAAMAALVHRRTDAEKRLFDIQNIPDTNQRLQAQLDNPEAFVYAFWEEAMTKFLVNATTFGSYCHEGRDLAMDFLRSRGLSMSNDCLLWTLSDIANRLVEEYEGRYCSYCNDDDEEEGEYDE